MVAARNDNSLILEKLINNGANLYAKNRQVILLICQVMETRLVRLLPESLDQNALDILDLLLFLNRNRSRNQHKRHPDITKSHLEIITMSHPRIITNQRFKMLYECSFCGLVSKAISKSQ